MQVLTVLSFDMFHFDFVCIIFSFSLSLIVTAQSDDDIFHTSILVLSEEDTPKEDMFYKGKLAILGNLSKGHWISDLDAHKEESLLLEESVCDIEKFPAISKIDTERTYLASVCVNPQDCLTTKGHESLLNSSCPKGNMCCRVDKVKSFKSQDIKFKPFREFPRMNFDPNASIIGQYQPLTLSPNQKAWRAEFINRTLMNMFPVCGMKQNIETSLSFGFRLFLCTREDLCGRPQKGSNTVPDRTQKAMNMFCENVPLEEYYPSKSKNRVCCDSEFIKQINVKDEKTGTEVHPFIAVPHVPFYLKFAPGFRASYMCEVYARTKCESSINNCQYECPLDYKYTRNNKFMYDDWVEGDQVLDELPHQALLGAYLEEFYFLFHCGGTLISRRWVLSTQRCAEYNGITTNLIMLGTSDTLGAIEENHFEVIYLVLEILIYPFNETKHYGISSLYDYALFKTHEEVNFTKYIRPACLFHTDPPVNWSELFFSGFGGSYNFVKRIKMITLLGNNIGVTGCHSHELFSPEDKYYSTYGGRLDNVICGRTVPYNGIVTKPPRYKSPCKYDQGGPLQFRLPLPYCMYQVYAVLSSLKESCNDITYMNAFQLVKFALHNIEEIVWKYPFLEEFPIPILNPKNFKFEPIWYNKCEGSKCPAVEIVKHHEYGEPDVIYTKNYDIPIVSDLNKGILPNVFDEVSRILANDTLCDVEKYNKTPSPAIQQGLYKYVPALCVSNSGDNKGACTSKFGGKYSVKSCETINKVCCSVANQPRITRALGHNISLIAHDDLLNYKVNDDVIFSGDAQENISNKEYSILKDLKNRNAIQKEFVCGIKKYIYPENKKMFSPFFCAKLSNCRKSSNIQARRKRKSKKSWEDICIRGGEVIDALRDKPVCCHPLDFVKSDFSQKISWEFQELPLYLKYAPGIRAAYKCEEYYRYVCENERDGCVKFQGAHFATPHEVPHMAQIGFIVPKIMFFYCGGAIVSPRYVISSVLCGFRRGIMANVVLVGDYNQTDIVDHPGWEKLYPLREVLPYPFERKLPVTSKGILDNRIKDKITSVGIHDGVFSEFIDIALFRTIEDIVFSQRIKPICLYYSPVDDIARALFTGFGYLPENNTRSELMKTDPMDIRKGSKLRRWEDCGNPALFNKMRYQYYAQVGITADHLFCAINAGYREGPCKYDDGGPLVTELKVPYCTSQLLGVLVAGHVFCNDVSPLVFVNITKFLTEIEDVLWPFPFLDLYTEEEPPLCLKNLKNYTNIYSF